MNAGEFVDDSGQGAWVRLKDVYSSPTELLKDEFRSMRQMIPDSMRRNLPAENIPEDHQMGSPYPVDIEILSLFVNGFAGTSPESLLTIQELSTSLKDIYSAEKWPDVEKLLQNNFLSLQDRISRNKEILDSQLEIQKIDNLKNLLDTWNPLRIQELVRLTESHDSIESVRSLHEAMMVEISKNTFDSLRPTRDAFLLLVSPIVQLTPHEIADIAVTEKKEGYLYLDSLVEIINLLSLSYNEAMRVELETVQLGGSQYTSDSGIDSREVIMREYLRYGAGSSVAIRNEAEKLFGTGRRLPNHPPAEPSTNL